MGTMIRMLQLNPPSPGAPGIFRCAQPGLMRDLFHKSGLVQVKESVVEGKLFCGNIDTYWSFITEAASPVAFSKADEVLKNQIREEVLRKVMEKFPYGVVTPGSSATVICGEKPTDD